MSDLPRHNRCVICVVRGAGKATIEPELRVSVQADHRQNMYLTVDLPLCEEHYALQLPCIIERVKA